LAVGHTLGHYRIESKLGEGGMGVVWKAWDMHLDLDIAVLTDATLKPGQIVVIDLNNDSSQTVTVNGTEMGSWSASAAAGSRVFLTDAVDGESQVMLFDLKTNKVVGDVESD